MNEFTPITKDFLLKYIENNDMSVLRQINSAFEIQFSSYDFRNSNFISTWEHQIAYLLDVCEILYGKINYSSFVSQIFHLIINITKKIDEIGKFSLYQAEALFKLGKHELALKNPGLAIDSFLASSSIYETYSLPIELALCYANIAYIYYLQERYDKAISYALPAQQKLYNSKHNSEYSSICDLLSLLYLELDEKDLAIRYLQESCREQIPVIPSNIKLNLLDFSPQIPNTKNPRLTKLKSQEIIIKDQSTKLDDSINQLHSLCFS
ncbi:hypothetical protein TVAG_222760 [Trichomonas vaginalis G3]|uniref:TPR Domain containing protein n=1 Tax=Trichomonas vaginalis (strain ATCC PRA-98 / G3) TaxID=412133 RepID=A2FHX1_TRIV3|nr:TPR-like family [Trichomonas vaginalis G3]EAX95480.1 hypothetical protein TVAG_222760 [Trichomonas vaginalis G3]KAI5531087.1 TPR-like family [Trichomonas vaginalis G3]|eukprot:XP_001308410.1 hypothetical protein [Trichomonas vaginalis G3]